MDAQALDELATERLEAELTTLAAHLAAGECRFLLLVAEFDRREAYLQWGCRTAAFWLSWKCGLNIRSSQEKLRVARALTSFPRMVQEFAAGRLSYAKVRAITRVAIPETEEALVELALHATAAHVESVARAYRGVLSTEEETERAVSRRANRSHTWDCDDEGDGSLTGHYRMAPEDGATFLAAIDAAAKDIRKQHPEVRYAASFADALGLIAESYLANGPATRKSGDRYLSVINIDADVLAFDTDGECFIRNGPALAPETARRLTCDNSGVVVVRGSAGEILNVGRKTRTIPPAIRRALNARDVRCRWPGCDELRYLDGHHARHWAHGGLTALSNLVNLCWHHHFLVHEGGWTLTIRGDGSLRIVDPNGNLLADDATTVEGSEAELVNQHVELGIDDMTAVPKWYGDSLDFDHAITGLLSLRDPSFATHELAPACRPQSMPNRSVSQPR
jgi:hypothetical protein